MLYIGLDSYSFGVTEKICAAPRINGVLLGDLFCQRRMFEGGDPELFKTAKQITDSGKQVFYQTPMYLTERNYEKEIFKIRFLAQSGFLHGLIIQDIGLLDEMNSNKKDGSMSDIPLIWNCIAIGRSRSSNALYYQTLAEYGADFIAASDANVYRALLENRLNPVLVVGMLQYRTMNRECFYKYLNDIYDYHCDRKCLSDRQRLVSANGALKMSVDGHILGENYLYETDQSLIRNAQNIICYAKDYDSAMNIITGDI